MNIAITQFELKPDKINELKSIWDALLKEALKQKGLHKALLLTSPRGKCLAIGFWDSFDDAKAWGSTSTYQSFVGALKELAIGKLERELYSVSSGDLSGILD